MFISRSLVIGIVIQFLLSSFKGAESSVAEDKLHQELFKTRSYSRQSRAVEDYRDAVSVIIGIHLVKIVQVDEYNEVLRINIVERLMWFDYRLEWNKTEFDGIEEIYVDPSTIWQPDIRLLNDAKDVKDKGDGLNLGFVRLSSDGLCTFFSAMELLASQCDMDITWFPFDDQKCPLWYESWKHEGHEVELSVDPDNPVYMEGFSDTGEWTLLDIPYNETTSVGHISNFTRAIFTLHLRRKYLYYVINLIFPCTLFSIIAIVTFLVPPECGERIGLGITILLSLSVYQMVINEKLPTTSDATPIMGIYFTFVIAISALSVTMSVIVLNVQHRSSSEHAMPLPNWAKRLICVRLAKLLRMKVPAGKLRPSHSKGLCDESLTNTDDHEQTFRLLDLTGRRIDNGPAAAAAAAGDGEGLPGTNNVNYTDALLAGIKGALEARLRADSEERDERTKTDEWAAEWISASLVLDKLFFILAAACLVFGSAILFLMVVISKLEDA